MFLNLVSLEEKLTRGKNNWDNSKYSSACHCRKMSRSRPINVSVSISISEKVGRSRSRLGLRPQRLVYIPGKMNDVEW